MADTQSHGVLRIRTEGDVVFIQPAAPKEKEVDTLSISLATGKVDRFKKEQVYGKEYLALIGLYELPSGWVLAAVKAAQQVAVLSGSPVFKVTSTQVIKGKAKFSSTDKKLLALLSDATDPERSGRNLFFAYGCDLTLTRQRLADALANSDVSSKPIPERADNRFFWNRQLCLKLIDAGAQAFVLTMVLGSIAQLRGLTLRAAGRAVRVSITLIGRRSVQRAGTRHWRRGADKEGSAANFVETEQVVSFDGGATVASFVQVRGSIPLLWTQIPNIKYKPPTKLRADSSSGEAFGRHVDALVQHYKRVVAVSLVNLHGSEGRLAAAFRESAQRYITSHAAPPAPPLLKYVAFDFHKECGAKNYHRISLLWQQIADDFADFGYFLQEGGSVTRRQGGVFRTNCIDCLDRTNVVQGVLGRKALEAALAHVGLLGARATLPAELPEVEARFKVLWADHGDDVSRQYAGTGALKSGFTRTGKRTLAGLVDDGIKSAARYYLNNFQDGAKQDAIDLVTGAFPSSACRSATLKSGRSPALPLLLALLSVMYAALQLSNQWSSSNTAAAGLGAFVPRVMLPFVCATLLVGLVIKNGRHLVNKPQLCPMLADTVSM